MLGPSGCGKTTTLRMIGGFEEPTAGAIYLGDREVSGLPPYKRDVNTVFQSYALFPHLSIFENVAFGLRRRGVQRRRADGRASRRCSSWSASTGSAERKPRQLSGGQQQRVALARALVNQPARPAPRRAARRARPEAPQADAARAEAHPARGRDHVRPRHARPGRGDDDGRHDRGHERRPDRAARLARPSCTSSPRTAFVAGFLGVSNLLHGIVSGVRPRPARTAAARCSSLRRRSAGPRASASASASGRRRSGSARRRQLARRR